MTCSDLEQTIFLEQYHKKNDKLLDHIIIGNETRVSHLTPETKNQSHLNGVTYHHQSKSRPSTQSVSGGFSGWMWSCWLTLLNKRQQLIVNYCTTLTKLQQAIQNKHHGLLMS